MSNLKFGIIMDPIAGIDIDKDTTFVMMLEAQKRGHELHYMEMADLYIRDTVPHAAARPLHVTRGKPHYSLQSGVVHPLASRLPLHQSLA